MFVGLRIELPWVALVVKHCIAPRMVASAVSVYITSVSKHLSGSTAREKRHKCESICHHLYKPIIFIMAGSKSGFSHIGKHTKPMRIRS